MEGSPRKESESEPARKRKRKRIVISCTECHRRKQKCDRSFPCSNCVARDKQSSCRYENEAARKEELLEEAKALSARGMLSKAESGSAQVAAMGYTKATGGYNTTLDLFNSIENHGSAVSDLMTAQMPALADYSSLRERYKSLIRQLPSKNHIDKLLVAFFEVYNPQYYPLDEGIFRDLLRKWNSLPFPTLNRGPQELHPDLQFFPALLFQMLALALQFQALDHDPSLDNLKYAAAMTLDDLATDYSESGVSILSLLGKRSTTLVTVQAGFLRCSYLKNCGLVIESWHFLSQTIRDAQEIDLHRPVTDSQPHRAEEVVDNLWVEQLRRRVWVLLTIWDIRMALSLGRPTTIDFRNPKYPFPVDAPVPKNRHEIAPAPRASSDPPTPLTVLLWNAELASPLWDIALLEKEGPHPRDFSKVERMHRLLNHVNKQCPAYFRAQNPDTTFDLEPGCDWLPKTRAVFQSLAAFNIMALHRPYIFSQASSRTAALKAALDILRSQRSLFELIDVKDYKMHSLVLSTFDALVLSAAVYIFSPLENRRDFDETLQHFEWGLERTEAITVRSSMASSALNILKAIHVRLEKLRSPSQQTALPSDASLSSKSNALSERRLSQSEPENNSSYPPPPTGNVSSASMSPYNIPALASLPKSFQPIASPTTSSSYNMASSPALYQDDRYRDRNDLQPLDVTSIAPPQPLHDLLYNDLSTFCNDYATTSAPDPAVTTASWDGIPETLGPATAWHFGGDFSSDSFWGLMNQFHPQ